MLKAKSISLMQWKFGTTALSSVAISGWLYACTMGNAALAQAPAPNTNAAGAGQEAGALPMAGNTPVDIQATEQEFAGDHVVAKGNVRVNYKGTLVIGSQATLFRDAQGQPQYAVFTGHPHLIQEDNKMDADTLTFEMSDSKIVADGNAHSEVLSGDSDDAKKKEPAAQPGGAKLATKPSPAKAPASAKAPAAKKQEKNDWQTDDDAAQSDQKVANNADGIISGAPSESEAPKAKPPEKIYTDADHQVFEQNTGHFEATGHVHVRHGDIKVTANHLQLVYGSNKKPETALFDGNVSATQNENNTKADAMTYFLATQRLQAAGNVRSKVLQEKQATGPKKGTKAASTTKPSASADGQTATPAIKSKANSRKVAEEQGATFVAMDMTTESDEPVYIFSDAQDYTKGSGRTSAEGNVIVYYNQSVGKGQHAILLRDEEGRTERIIFLGRSQITQPGKRWIADKITFMVPDQRVIAEGNTKAIILNPKATVQPDDSNKETKPSEENGPAEDVDGGKLAKNDSQNSPHPQSSQRAVDDNPVRQIGASGVTY